MGAEPKRYLREFWGSGREMKIHQSSRTHENKKLIVWWSFSSGWKIESRTHANPQRKFRKTKFGMEMREQLQVRIKLVERFRTSLLNPWLHLRFNLRFLGLLWIEMINFRDFSLENNKKGKEADKHHVNNRKWKHFLFNNLKISIFANLIGWTEFCKAV